MLEFLIDNILGMFGGRAFQQTVGIPMGTNCCPLLGGILYFNLNGIDATNTITTPGII
jgi:hypothetical protein